MSLKTPDHLQETSQRRMRVLRVVPLESVPVAPELSYFAAQHVPEGSVVRIPLRRKVGYGLVTESKDASDEKLAVRKGTFALKKISPSRIGAPFSRPFLRAVFESAPVHATHPGALLGELVPRPVLKKAALFPAPPSSPRKTRFEMFSITASRAERAGEYRRLAREALARGASVLLICPSVLEAATLAREVGRGIEERVVLIYGSMREKEFLASWKKALDSRQSVLVVGTPVILAHPRNDIEYIVLERESSRNYEKDSRPYLSVGVVAERLAQALGVPLLYGNTVPSLATFVRKKEHAVQDLSPFSGRLGGISPQVIDMRRKNSEPRPKRFDPLGSEAHALLDTLGGKEPVLIVAARKGLAPLTSCDDCGSILSCSSCGSALVLHKGDVPKFVCHYCGEEEKASVRCKNCSGWRLTTLGIAIDRVLESVAARHPSLSAHAVSRETLREKDPADIIATFLQDRQVLVSTEVLIPYLPEGSAAVIVASIDSLFSIPEYAIEERVFGLLAELRSIARGSLLLQTRNPGHRVVGAAQGGSFTPLLETWKEERLRFRYPPLATLIRVSLGGAGAPFHIREIAAKLSPWDPEVLEGKGARRGETRAHCIMRLRKGAWIDWKLLKYLRTLPPAFAVRVNPPTLFE